jgi:hypothetical protein
LSAANAPRGALLGGCADARAVELATGAREIIGGVGSGLVVLQPAAKRRGAPQAFIMAFMARECSRTSRFMFTSACRRFAIMKLELYLTNGQPGGHLAATLVSDRYSLVVHGSDMVEPPVEIGSYRGVSGSREALLLSTAGARLEESPSANELMAEMPFAHVSVSRELGDIERIFTPAELPDTWQPTHRMLTRLIDGPWRADANKFRTVSADARWLAEEINADERATLIVTLKHTGSSPLRIGDPDVRECWRVVIEPMGEAETEAFEGALTGSELGVSSAGEAWEHYLWLDPGESVEVALAIGRELPPGRYRARATYRSARIGSRAPSGNAPLLEGVLQLAVEGLMVRRAPARIASK